MTKPMNLSHSQRNGWAGCGERYRLERIVKVPEVPSWFLVGGSAVHETTEARDLRRLGVASPQHSTEFEDNFLRNVENAEDKSGVDRSEFRAAGRRSKEWPDKESELWWLSNGPSMVNRWDTFINNVPWDIWIAPDGTPGIEIGFELSLDPDENGVPRVLDRGFIDRVMVDPATGELIVVDLKTGSSKQFSARQLGDYRVGLARKFGVDVRRGMFWDARTGLGDMHALNEFTLERINWQYQKVRQARELDIYIANPGPMCGSCSVNRYCLEYNPEATSLVRPPWVTPEEWGGPDVAA